MDRKSNRSRFLFFLIAPAIVLFPYFASTGLAKNVTLGWNANSEPDIEGYVIYRNPGSSGPPYKYDDTLPEDDLANPLRPMVTLTGLNDKTKYYVAVTAYDTDGNESYYSNEICFEIEDSIIKNCTASSGSVSKSDSSGGGGSGGGGGVCFINSIAEKSNSLCVLLIALVVVVLVLISKARKTEGFKARRLAREHELTADSS